MAMCGCILGVNLATIEVNKEVMNKRLLVSAS